MKLHSRRKQLDIDHQGKKTDAINKQKITHMGKRWGTPQNFFLAFIEELEKQIILKKNC